MPTIQADISGLADLASTYAVAAPDLVRGGEGAGHDQHDDRGEAGRSSRASSPAPPGSPTPPREFLERNGDRIIQAGRVGRPTLAAAREVLAAVPLHRDGADQLGARASTSAWKDETFHITLEVTPQRKGYQPGEEPAWGENRGPNCYGLPEPTAARRTPARATLRRRHQRPGQRGQQRPASAFTTDKAMGIADADSGLAGTEEEQQVVAALLSMDGPAEPSAITTLLAGPMLRGTVVSQR